MGRIITALEIQAHDHERVSVYLDGEFAFGLSALEAVKLHKGQELSEAEIAALQESDEVARAFDQVVNLLARRPYSTAEIRRHLANKHLAAPTIEEVLDRLIHLGYADDQAFASYWVENRERFRPRGPRALRYELRQKGITDDLIETTLSEFDAHDAAYRAAQEQVRRLHHISQPDFRQKIGAFLVRRGFEYDIVRAVIDQLIHELEDEQPDYFIDHPTDEE
ncbi:MAG: RecX family transcriptional regulator [Chloroflexi bacterium]|nr:RecX family transcriptional regulator [Chloroflexota bacterium]